MPFDGAIQRGPCTLAHTHTLTCNAHPLVQTISGHRPYCIQVPSYRIYPVRVAGIPPLTGGALHGLAGAGLTRDRPLRQLRWLQFSLARDLHAGLSHPMGGSMSAPSHWMSTACLPVSMVGIGSRAGNRDTS